jgi:suppressor of ftsI
MLRAKVGSYPHGRIVNVTKERHPLRNHPLPFLAYAQINRPIEHPLWPDTGNVAYGESADSSWITDPVIKGMSVFHGHLRNHQDKSVMTKILFEGKSPKREFPNSAPFRVAEKQGHTNK